MRRSLAALGAVLTAVALTLTACNSGYEQGPPGRVVAKDKEYDCHSTGTGKNRRQSCDWEYELTTRNAAGQDHEFEVSSSDYGDCRYGSAYPKCTKR